LIDRSFLVNFARYIISKILWCLHDPTSVQQTSSKCIQSTRSNAERLLDRVNTLYVTPDCRLFAHSVRL